MSVTLASLEDFESRLARVFAEHIRAYRVTDTLYRVVSVSSRQYKHPSRDPGRRRGLLHKARKWHYVTCVRLSDGVIRVSCNGEHCVYRVDGHGSTVCKHSIAVAAHLLHNPKAAEAVTGVPTV